MLMNEKHNNNDVMYTNQELFEKQKQTLDSFLKSGAIDLNQYNKSLNTLKEKIEIKYK